MEAEFLRALTARGDDVLLDLEVTPGAREARFPDGTNPWRRRIRIRVRAPPEDGKANAEVCRLVAKTLGIPAAAVHITSGHTSTQKTVAIEGVSAERVLTRLVEGSA